MHGIPRDIHEGMKVYDRTNAEIGTVEMVKFSDEDPTTPEVETAGVNPIEEERDDNLVESIARVFRSDELPEELRERLLREGFVLIDADGLFEADRYVLPDQIASVSGDRLVLKASKAELIKRH